jgi:hypothetical protein
VRSRLKKLERQADSHAIVIPQQSLPPAKFPRSALKEAFVNGMNQIKAAAEGRDLPPDHELVTAAKNSRDPAWRRSFFSGADLSVPITEDLSDE